MIKDMHILQPIDELEKFWEDPDPWNYENNPHDLNRRAMLLSLIPRREYQRVLDIGCGNGFVTVRLPGQQIVGVDVSGNAVRHAANRSRDLPHISYQQQSLFGLPQVGYANEFDLIIVTGVLYPQYIAKSEKLVHCILDDILRPGGILITCHIEEWYTCRFPYITLAREYYSYREYTHILEVYRK